MRQLQLYLLRSLHSKDDSYNDKDIVLKIILNIKK